MRKCNLTAFRVAYLIWAACVIAILFVPIPDTAGSEPSEAPLPSEAPVETTTKLTVEDVATILLEDERIEAALLEQGYYRDDIPLTYLEQDFLHTAADRFGVPYELALAVVWKETNFRNISGDNGASAGYMQIQQRWHEERMARLGVTDLTDPYSNFLVGCDYLAEMIAKDRGIEWALHAYNGGPSYANKMAKAEKVSQYAKDVLNYMNNLGGN